MLEAARLPLEARPNGRQGKNGKRSEVKMHNTVWRDHGTVDVSAALIWLRHELKQALVN